MLRCFLWCALIVCTIVMTSGCKGDEKGVNHNKEKPEPARTEKVNPNK
jgi:hypothetical protein